MSVVRTLAWYFHILEIASIHTGEHTNNNLLDPSAERSQTAKIALYSQNDRLPLLSLFFSLD